LVDSPVDADDTTGIGTAVSIRPRIVDLGSPVAPSLRAAIWMPAAPMSLPINALARGDTDSAWGCRSSAGSCNIAVRSSNSAIIPKAACGRA